MIYNQWYIVLESKELHQNTPLKIVRFGEALVMWRDSGSNIACIEDRCCHRGASLACGKIQKGEIECPFHGYLYDKTGKVTTIPANGKIAEVPDSVRVKAYDVYEDFGFIWLWYGDTDKKSAKPFYFEELREYTYSSFKDEWAVHYSRAIENQLDVVHVPFVHKSTIGKGNKTMVNGPVVERDGDMITFYVNNVLDDGKTVALKPSEIQNYKDLYYLKFHFPNVWQNYITDKIRVMAAFVPVDDENSIVYIRYYQKITTFPILKDFMNWTGKLFCKKILREDKHVVVTQLPKKSELKMDEKLIMGDMPIIEYRKRRDELKNLVNQKSE